MVSEKVVCFWRARGTKSLRDLVPSCPWVRVPRAGKFLKNRVWNAISGCFFLIDFWFFGRKKTNFQICKIAFFESISDQEFWIFASKLLLECVCTINNIWTEKVWENWPNMQFLKQAYFDFFCFPNLHSWYSTYCADCLLVDAHTRRFNYPV